MNDNFKKLDWDSEFFGYNVYLIQKENLNEFELTEILHYLKSNNTKLVYWFTKSPKDFVDNNNGLLADIKITYCKKIHEDVPHLKFIRSFDKNEDYNKLIPLSIQSGSYSRYYTDKNFLNNEFKKLYVEWIKNSVLRKIANEVLVYDDGDSIKGLVSIKAEEKVATIGLISVDKEHRGKKIGNMLLKAAEKYVLDLGVDYINVSTQYSNEPACNFYKKNNYILSTKRWIYHFWLK